MGLTDLKGKLNDCVTLRIALLDLGTLVSLFYLRNSVVLHRKDSRSFSWATGSREASAPRKYGGSTARLAWKDDVGRFRNVIAAIVKYDGWSPKPQNARKSIAVRIID